MKILYDHQIFSAQIYGGISRYFCELMRCFASRGVDFDLGIAYSNNSYLAGIPQVRPRPFFKDRKFFGKTTLLNFANKTSSIRALRQGNYDLFHPTYYDPYFLKYLGRKPYVVTVYDMVHELYPELFPADEPVRIWKEQSVRKADLVIAISHSTKNDLVRLYGLDPDKVKVIWLANSLLPPRGDRKLPTLPGRYILFVGQRSGYKNFDLFISAVAPILVGDPELAVVCAGGGRFTPAEEARFEELGIAGRVEQSYVDDDVLSSLYQGASAFVYPSLYEGFGIPLLEAFACGCPVVASRASSFPEVAGEAAVFFDPSDAASLRAAVERVVYSDEVRRELIASGSERIKEFSWEKAARETLSVYEMVL